MSPQVLILGVDWHGDVAPYLSKGLRMLGALTNTQYLLSQRRNGFVSRVQDELVHLPYIGNDLREVQLEHASQRITQTIEKANADVVIALAPELLSRESVEAVLDGSVAVWWFGDDPFNFQRRGLKERPSVLEYLEEPSCVSYVAHPYWARAEASGSQYLPYASCYEPCARDSVSVTNHGRAVVVASPRSERIKLLAELSSLLGDRLEIWGWGRRARIGLVPGARSFRTRLQGAGSLGRHEVEEVFRAAGVVLNLQDEQMVGAWNPQAFDLMGLAIPQVVWNADPVPMFDIPPPWGDSATRIAAHAERLLDDRDSHDWLAGAEEVANRHLWVHRAETLLRDASEVAR